MKKIIIILAMPLLFAGCKKLFEPYDEEFYYNVEGFGYIINGETNQPFCRGLAFYRAETERNGSGWWGSGPIYIDKEFEVDENGFFRVKFLKRTNRRDVVSYGYPINLRYKGEELTLSIVQNAKNNFQLDTIKIFPDTIMIAESYFNEYADTVGASIDNIYAENGIWKIENGVDWLTFGLFFYPYQYHLLALPLPDSATECRNAIITAEYPNGRKDKYIVVQAPRSMGNNPNCFK